VSKSEITFSVHESPEGGYEAQALGDSIFTQAETLDELQEMVREAVRCHCDSEPLPNIILHEDEDPRSSRVNPRPRSF